MKDLKEQVKNSNDLKRVFKEEKGIKWENSQGEPDIEYVWWLEETIVNLLHKEKLSDQKEVTDEVQNMEGTLSMVRQIIEDVEELNMVNYTYDQVKRLNEAMVEIYQITHTKDHVTLEDCKADDTAREERSAEEIIKDAGKFPHDKISTPFDI